MPPVPVVEITVMTATIGKNPRRKQDNHEHEAKKRLRNIKREAAATGRQIMTAMRLGLNILHTIKLAKTTAMLIEENGI